MDKKEPYTLSSVCQVMLEEWDENEVKEKEDTRAGSITDCTKENFEAHSTGARKETANKLRFDLIPPEVTEAYAETLTVGCKKYCDRNWEKGLKLVEHHLAAAMRHINKWQKGEDMNIERDTYGRITSSSNHMKHALWHVAAIVTQIERGRKDLDDRVKV